MIIFTLIKNKLKYMNFFNSKVLLFISILSISCSENELNERLLAKASGTPGELFVVMDSTQWHGDLGRAVKNTLISSVPGLPNEEPHFRVHYIEPTKFNSVLERVTNILFVATLDSKTKGGVAVRNKITKNYIEEHPDKFMISQSDVYAKGQSVLYLFGSTQEELTKNISINEKVIRNFFNNAEKKRLEEALYKTQEKIGISKTLLNTHGLHMRIPNGYRIEENVPGFIWIRSPGTANESIDKNILITYKPYTSETAFNKKEIIAWRDEFTKEKVFENPENIDSYMETDTINVPVDYNSVKLGGNFAKEIRGIWKTHNLGIGGPYISYVVLDNDSKQIFYLDGFIVSPSKPKRESIRQLETILSTFRTKNQMEVSEQKASN